MNYEASKSADLKLLREVVGVIAPGEEQRRMRTSTDSRYYYIIIRIYAQILGAKPQMTG